MNYTFGGSVLDAAPFQVRPDQPATSAPFTRNTYGGTIGGPVKLGSLYDGTRKTNFVLTYNGNHGSTVFDQYATVPTLAQRAGDFSASRRDAHQSGHGPAVSQQPDSRRRRSRNRCCRTFRSRTWRAPQNNFHYSSTQPSASDTINLRVTHNFTPAAAGGRGGGGRGGGGGAAAGAVGAATRRATGTSVNMTAQLQFRRTDNDTLNVNPLLGGHSANRSLAVPVTFNIRHKRTMHTASINFSSTSSTTTNHFSGVTDVAEQRRASTPASAIRSRGACRRPPFSQFQAVRDVTPAQA